MFQGLIDRLNGTARKRCRVPVLDHNVRDHQRMCLEMKDINGRIRTPFWYDNYGNVYTIPDGYTYAFQVYKGDNREDGLKEALRLGREWAGEPGRVCEVLDRDDKIIRRINLLVV